MTLPVLAIAVFDGVELLDFAGPLEVFSAATELAGEAPWRVLTVSLGDREVRSAHGLTFRADVTADEAPVLHGLLIPGGVGVRQVMKTPAQMNWLIERGEQADILMSVCTGAFVLGAAGFLQGIRATTHQQYLDELRQLAPACDVVTGARLVRSGRVLTSAGVSAGLDLALAVVRDQLGDELAARVSAYVEYPPTAAVDPSVQPAPPS
ncbi:MAG: DJ-1/PfpI family protein [Pseudomonadota bacterium]